MDVDINASHPVSQIGRSLPSKIPAASFFAPDHSVHVLHLVCYRERLWSNYSRIWNVFSFSRLINVPTSSHFQYYIDLKKLPSQRVMPGVYPKEACDISEVLSIVRLPVPSSTQVISPILINFATGLTAPEVRFVAVHNQKIA